MIKDEKRLQTNLCQKRRRKITNNMATKKYEKTPRGFLMRAYRNMQSRISGIQKAKFHLYVGLSLLGRQEFYNWAHKSAEFKRLYGLWVASGFDRCLTPSVDRVNSNRGYILDNMEWVTHSENSRRGALSPYRSR